MATQFGTLKEFQPESDAIKAYLERVELYFTTNSVDEDKQVPILLSAIGSATYALLSDLLAPDPPKTKSLSEISVVLRRHYEPKRAVIAERFHFHKRDQAVGESITDYDAALRRLATHCRFGGTLEEVLRDRLVCGLRHENIQRRLLSEVELTYAKAMDIARSMEAADKNTKSFKPSDPAIQSFSSQSPRTKERRPGYRCGRSAHDPAECKFKDAECHHCGKRRHIAPACRSKNQPTRRTQPKPTRNKKRRNTNRVQDDDPTADTGESSGEDYHLHKMGTQSSPPVEVDVVVNGTSLTMEVDTGAAVSIISEKTRRALLPHLKLHASDLVLRTYTEEPIKVIGTLNVRVQYGSQAEKLVLVVVGGDGPSLFGRNWLRYLRLDWNKIASIRSAQLSPLKLLMQQHQSLFADELGTVDPYKATLNVRPDATPRFFKPRSVPFAIKDAIGKELDRLEQQGIIKKVTHSEWAAPIVTVPKKDGRYRICGDYKVTINKAMDVDQYPLPKPEDLFATLAGGKVFSKLDLSQAYLQLQLDEKSTSYTTINTHQGLYCYKRLPFGVASAPALFQKMMDTVLRGIPGVICYIDDILVSGKDEESHLRSLAEVFKRLEQHNFRLKQEKCEFLLTSVEYLGHRIGKDGIQALKSKTDAIVNAPVPRNVQELRSFLGLLNYYGKFIPNLATVLHPLNSLLRADTKWVWTKECGEAFNQAKLKLTSAEVLAHYDPMLPLSLAADASAYGVGAVISHTFPDGSERPIAFASRTLTTSEKNYAQLEKEALSLVFGIKKFHQYLYGRRFTLITDHKPLTTILGPKKGIPSLAAARLQRWAIHLSAYDYKIQYKSTHAHSNADGLSRLPLPAADASSKSDGVSLFNVAQVQALPVTFQDVRKATRQDKVLSAVYSYVQHGWPARVPEKLKPYQSHQNEIGFQSGCLMWGVRVIIPEKLQSKLLQSLHESHPGITRMKALARSYFWWSGLDKAIEDLAKSCESCQAIKPNPPTAPLHPWVWPDTPWKRIHVDFAGPFQGKMFFT